jgi:hypothetical protein
MEETRSACRRCLAAAALSASPYVAATKLVGEIARVDRRVRGAEPNVKVKDAEQPIRVGPGGG